MVSSEGLSALASSRMNASRPKEVHRGRESRSFLQGSPNSSPLGTPRIGCRPTCSGGQFPGGRACTRSRNHPTRSRIRNGPWEGMSAREKEASSAQVMVKRTATKKGVARVPRERPHLKDGDTPEEKSNAIKQSKDITDENTEPRVEAYAYARDTLGERRPERQARSAARRARQRRERGHGGSLTSP